MRVTQTTSCNNSCRSSSSIVETLKEWDSVDIEGHGANGGLYPYLAASMLRTCTLIGMARKIEKVSWIRGSACSHSESCPASIASESKCSTLELLYISLTSDGYSVKVMEAIRNYCKQLSVIK